MPKRSYATARQFACGLAVAGTGRLQGIQQQTTSERGAGMGRRRASDTRAEQIELEDAPTLAELRYQEFNKHSSGGARFRAKIEYNASSQYYECQIIDDGRTIKGYTFRRYVDACQYLLSDSVKEYLPPRGGWIFTNVEPIPA
jgi:hypothetical protein